MGIFTSIKNGAKKFVKTSIKVLKGVKGATKWSVDTFVVKPVGFLSSWIPQTKKLRIQVFILRDNITDRSLLNAAARIELDNAISYATTTFRSKFDIDLIAYGSPLIQILPKPAPIAALDVACDFGAIKNELGAAGTYFEKNLAGWNVVPISLTFPISIFIVRTIAGKIGCSLGAASDYVTLSSVPESTSSVSGISSLSTLAHELAHCCGLYHRNEVNNLMYENDSDGRGNVRGSDVTYWQKTIVRSSRHVTFL